MRISHNSRFRTIDPKNGYGYATDRILDSLARLGHEVKTNDSEAPVGFWFDQPHHYTWPSEQYKIGYHPWESTKLISGWKGMLNACDEVWTPSPLIADWYRDHNGITKPVHVYEHGIDPVWEVRPRAQSDKLTFLHVGGESLRKGLPLVLKAFRAAFNGSSDYDLTCKLGTTGFNLDHHGNVTTISGKLPLQEQIDLHYQRHVFVYPSWGEGFGFNPFQAMATGMPSILPAVWAPYKRFVDPNLDVASTLVDSPWPAIHPGKMYEPNLDDLVDKMCYVADNYTQCHDFAQAQAPKIHAEYNWDKVTKAVFDSLESRLA